MDIEKLLIILIAVAFRPTCCIRIHNNMNIQSYMTLIHIYRYLCLLFCNCTEILPLIEIHFLSFTFTDKLNIYTYICIHIDIFIFTVDIERLMLIRTERKIFRRKAGM